MPNLKKFRIAGAAALLAVAYATTVSTARAADALEGGCGNETGSLCTETTTCIRTVVVRNCVTMSTYYPPAGPQNP